MKLLLDSHLLLWGADEIDKLSPVAREQIENPSNDLFFSVASLWELSIKRALGKRGFGIDPRVLRSGLLDNGYSELVIQSEHAFFVGVLPPIHRDPFDRILIAQASVEGILLLTSDPIVARYPGPIQKV